MKLQTLTVPATIAALRAAISSLVACVIWLSYSWKGASTTPLLASVPLLLLWVCRLWLHTERGRMHDDPIVFALKDRASWAILGLLAVTVGVARLAKF